MFHDQLLTGSYNNPGGRVPPFFSGASIFARDMKIDFPNAYFTQVSVVGGAAGVLPQTEGFEFAPKQQTVLKWSFDIQQQVTSSTTVEVGYSGTRGIHLQRGAMQMNLTPSEIRDGRRYILLDQPLPNPYWNRIRWISFDSESDYHALRMTMNKRFSHGFQFQSAYTFSKSIDNRSSGGGGDFGAADVNGYGREKRFGLSSFDVRHSFNTTYVYELPGGHWSGAAGKLLGGWRLAGLLRLNSGHPINLTAQQPRLVTPQRTFSMQFVDGSTLDLVPGGNPNDISPRNPNQYFDPSQFSFPTPFFQGNLGRNVTISPGTANFDATLMKDIALGFLSESTKLEFRAEFFNLFNRANFGLPARSLFDRDGRPQSNAG